MSRRILMRLSKEDYKKAEGCLRRYNYNCITIMNIRADIMSVGAPSTDGMPKAPYSISDTVYNQVIRLQEDKELQKCLKEYQIGLVKVSKGWIKDNTMPVRAGLYIEVEHIKFQERVTT